MTENEIKKIAKYFQLPLGKLSYNEDNVIQLKTAGGEKLVGFSTILKHFQSGKENKSSESYYLTRQFFDYANIFLRGTSKRDKATACAELNAYLESRSYLVGQNITMADLVVFYAIAPTMQQLTSLDKDQFVNLSRWYDHLQQLEAVRQGTSLVNFTSIHLLSSRV